ncbi:unnamed protein product [Darwinula stevensoni]|uniref:Uncharacterized protein n=1 Tax=Darwinula stevensoni TaxID=69355 RepID=A0A7R8XBA5_9CRUS|nr:unnamed protein product [Darwinula stevensoni]CAG0891384.1 unnamed protein product [Darwinula stevensoni]
MPSVGEHCDVSGARGEDGSAVRSPQEPQLVNGNVKEQHSAQAIRQEEMDGMIDCDLSAWGAGMAIASWEEACADTIPMFPHWMSRLATEFSAGDPRISEPPQPHNRMVLSKLSCIAHR